MTTKKDFTKQISDYLGWKIESGQGISSDDIADIAEKAGLTFNPEPVTGLLGKWAEHPEHGRGLITSDKPDEEGLVTYARLNPKSRSGATSWFCNFSDLKLIADKPLVTTEDEYAELPDGSIVAEPIGFPFYKSGDSWTQDDDYWSSNRVMDGTTRQVLRRGWGDE